MTGSWRGKQCLNHVLPGRKDKKYLLFPEDNGGKGLPAMVDCFRSFFLLRTLENWTKLKTHLFESTIKAVRIYGNYGTKI